MSDRMELGGVVSRFAREEVFYRPSPEAKWWIEKITTTHGAHLNNPAGFPLGWWYGCKIDDYYQYLCTEFCAPSWDRAIARIA